MISEDAIAKAASLLNSQEAEEETQQETVEVPESEVIEPTTEVDEEPQAEAEPEQEAEVEEKAPKPQPSPEIDEQFKKLAEREREFRKREIQFKKQAEELSKKIQTLEERENKLNNPDHLLDILEAKGMSLADFQTKILTGDIKLEKEQKDPVLEQQTQLQKELQELKEFREQVLRQQEQAELEQHLNAYRGEIRKAVPQFENLTEWFGDSLDDVVAEAEQAAELYAQEYEEAPEVSDILSQLDALYGKKLERVKSKYVKPAAETAPKKEQPKSSGKALSHNHTRSIAADTSQDDVVSKVLKGNARDVMTDRAMELFKKHGQLT